MNTNALLPPDVEAAVRRECAGRTALWIGKPNARQAFRVGFLIWFFAIPWTAFSIFWTLGASGLLASGRSPFSIQILFGLFGLPFILIGLAMLATPFWVGRKAAKTAYIITQDRLTALSINGWGALEVASTQLSKVIQITRVEKPDGSGTLTLHTGWHKDSDGDRVKTEVKLIGIPDVRHVEALLNGQSVAR